jgi:YidC/Oxa1 family membrane protein insertase
MDKRTILFIFLVMVSFYTVNYFFGPNEEDTRRSQIEQQRMGEENEHLRVDIDKRTAELSDLSMVVVYSDKKGSEMLTTGVRVGDSIVTLALEYPMPKTVYVADANAPGKLTTMPLIIEAMAAGSPVVYGGESLKLANISEFGTFDVQLVELSKHAKVSLGVCVDGYFTALNGGDSDAIGLVKVGDKYLPLGFYVAQKKDMILLSKLPAIAKIAQTERVSRVVDTDEKFYVLENDYTQLVFSNHGGALAEVNLPFHSKDNEHSVVREIGLDRKMEEKHSDNDLFPGKPQYFTSSGEHTEGQLGGYYPLLRRDLIERGSVKKINSNHYACNIISDYAEVGQLVYDVKHFDSKSITFEAVQSFRRITKTFSFPEAVNDAPYVVDLVIKVEGDARGLRLTSGIPSVELGSSIPNLKMRSGINGNSKVKKMDLPKDVSIVGSIRPDWVSNSNGFFGLIVDPLTDIGEGYRTIKVSGVDAPTRLLVIDKEYDRYLPKDYPGYEMQLSLADKAGTMHFRYYAGPYDDTVLKLIDKTYTNPETGDQPGYVNCQSFHGFFSFISEPFAKFLMILMNFFYQLTSSWVASIIVLTITLRVMLYPLNSWSMKSMRRMQKISPLVSEIQKKNKKDPKKGQVEVMNLYKKHKVNPFGGCIPMLIQMPFLIGMFDLLRSSFQLRGATFVPGWIDDLTAPDMLFQWDYPIPFIGTAFHLLPVLLGGVMFLQQRMSSTMPKDKSSMTDQQKQQLLMGNMMTVVFTVMFYKFPAGLNIYWLSSMSLGILQQWLINRKIGDVVPIVEDRKGKK